MLVDQGAALTQHHFSMVRVKSFLLFCYAQISMKQCNGAYTIVDQSDAFALFVLGTSKPRNNDRNTAQKHRLANSCQPRKREMKRPYISCSSGSRQNLDINNFSLTLLCTFFSWTLGARYTVTPFPLSWFQWAYGPGAFVGYVGCVVSTSWIGRRPCRRDHPWPSGFPKRGTGVLRNHLIVGRHGD